MSKSLVFGIDVGKIVDPTALCAAVTYEKNGETHYDITALQRLPIGLRYPEQSDVIIRMLERAATYFEENIEWSPTPEYFIHCDVGGVGEAFKDLLRPKLQDRFTLRPARFCHGPRLAVSGQEYSVGKEFIACRLQVLTEQDRIHINEKTPDGAAIQKELANFSAMIDENGKKTFGNTPGSGNHDDLVIALALACLRD